MQGKNHNTDRGIKTRKHGTVQMMRVAAMYQKMGGGGSNKK
jgi:hypothetical protein